MKYTILAFFFLFPVLGFSQIESYHPFDYLNHENEPELFSRRIITENNVTSLLIQDFVVDEYDTTKQRAQHIASYTFQKNGQIEAVYTALFIQKVNMDKERFLGKMKMVTGLKTDLIYEQFNQFYYNEKELLDSTFYLETSYSNTEYYNLELLKFQYDLLKRMVCQKKESQIFWKKNSESNDTITDWVKIKYKGKTLEYDTLITFRQLWGSTGSYDTIIGAPKTTYHLGYTPDKFELGENGFIKKVTRTHKVYKQQEKRKNPTSSGGVYNDYIVFEYNDSNQLISKRYLGRNLNEDFRVQYIYNKEGLIVRKETIKKGVRTLSTLYSYSSHIIN